MEEKDTFLAEVLPNIEEKNIDDLFLFYSEKDLIDRFYSIYLNCLYPESEYWEEKERLEELFRDDATIQMSESFKCEILLVDDIVDPGAFLQTPYVRYTYMLFDEEEHRIVYIMIFEKDLMGKSTKIPQEYLPRELVGLRNNK